MGQAVEIRAITEVGGRRLLRPSTATLDGMTDTTPSPVAQVPAPPAPVIVNVTQRADYKPTAHVFHLIMTIITGGLWLFVWIPVSLSHRKQNRNR